MDKSSIGDAVKQICDEKGIPLESVLETIEAALAAAYRKDFGEKNQNIKAEFDLESGESRLFDVKTVVEDVPEEELAEIQAEEERKEEEREERAKGGKKREERFERPEEIDNEEEAERRFNPKTEIQLSDAKKIKKSYKIDDIIKTELKAPGDFGRMAAQTAKQVIIQKLRETERATIFEEFKEREGEILVGTVQRREGRLVLVDLGRATALLPPEEQIHSENYSVGSQIKVYILSVRETTKGPEIIVSRSHPEIVRKLFILEIPEIANDVIEIKGISREAGSRSKVAVYTEEDNIDPIGSCIGQRGARIQTIISELKGEKVDIIKYSDDPEEFIANSLSPAKILDIKVNEEERTAVAQVAEDQLSLAIGKAGQNVRLAARLTGWKIDIISEDGKKVEDAKPEDVDEPSQEDVEEENEVEAENEDKEDKPKKDKKSKKEEN